MSLHDIISKINPLHKTVMSGDSEEIIELDENGEVASGDSPSLFFRKIFVSLVIILVASLSFGIGRLSVVGKREPIKIEYDASMTSISDNQINQTGSAANAVSVGQVVASKNGSKYHYPHCAGPKKIKEGNKITFQTPVAAEAAGFSLAANCSPR